MGVPIALPPDMPEEEEEEKHLEYIQVDVNEYDQ